MKSMFDKVLTLCDKCRKEITVKSTYEDRNNKYHCEECKSK